MQILRLKQAVAEITAALRARRSSSGRATDPFFLIVGSGLSTPPLPTAGEMEELFRKKLEADGLPLPELPDKPGERYARLFEAAYAQPEDRRHFLKELMKGKALSSANLRLAHFLGGRDEQGRPVLTHLVVTPNFDDQLSRALRLFGYDAEVVDNPATVAFLDRERTETVQIVHVHGTFRHYDCRNLTSEIRARARGNDRMRHFLHQVLNSNRSPLILGYSGWDGDVIMSTLSKHLRDRKGPGLANKLYWFCYRSDEQASLPSWLRKDRNVAFVLPEEPARETSERAAVGAMLESGERTLPAHRVIGELIRVLGVEPPRLAHDPLGFLADQLSRALDVDVSDAAPPLYNLERVLMRVNRGARFEVAQWTPTERALDEFWKAVQAGDGESAVKSAEELAGDNLDNRERGRVADQLLEVHLDLQDGKAELGVRACSAALALARATSPEVRSLPTEQALRIAQALSGLGYWRGAQGQSEDALAHYTGVVDRFWSHPAPAVRELVAWALYNQGVALDQQGHKREALESYAKVVSEFGDSPVPVLSGPVAWALYEQGLALGHKGFNREALDRYKKLQEVLGDTPASARRMLIAGALLNQGVLLGLEDRPSEEIETYSKLVSRFGADPTAGLRALVARALLHKNIALSRMGRGEEAEACYTELLERFGQDLPETLPEPVARALFYRG